MIFKLVLAIACLLPASTAFAEYGSGMPIYTRNKNRQKIQRRVINRTKHFSSYQDIFQFVQADSFIDVNLELFRLYKQPIPQGYWIGEYGSYRDY